MFFQVELGVIAALAQADIAIVEPCAALLHNAQLSTQIDHFAQFGDSLAEHDVKLGLTERGCHFVLDDLGAGTVADKGTAGVLQALNAAHINTYRGIIFQGAAAGGHFRVAVHHTDFFAQLVNKDADGVCFADDAGQLTQSLAHQAGLQANVGIAHFAFNFGFGHHGSNRVHNNSVNRAGAYQSFADFHGLLAGIRLADQQAVNVNAKGAGIGGIQGVLNVDKGNLAAQLLGFSQNMQGQGGFTGRFRPIYLNDASAWQAADAQRQVQPQAAGGNGIHLHGNVGPKLHHGAFAKLLFDLGQCRLQRCLFIPCRAGGELLG